MFAKAKPERILQDDAFEEAASVTACLLTTHSLDAPLVRPAIEPTPENGPHETSHAMIDKVTTMNRTRMGQRVGTLTGAAMARINRAILVFLGLAGQTTG